MKTIVQNLVTNYSRDGSGRQLLVLHGWADNGSNWQQFAHTLTKEYEVIVPDLPGFGSTEMPPDIWGIGEYATFVSEFIKKTKITPYAIIAHSNGGSIAIHAIANKLIFPTKLVLLASAGIRNSGKGRKRTLRVVAKTGKVFTSVLPASKRYQLRNKLYKYAGSDMLIVEELQETFKRIVSEDVRTDAELITIPTLLIYGTLDNSTPVEYGKILSESIPNSKLEIIKGGDHFIHIRTETQVINLLESFLK